MKQIILLEVLKHTEMTAHFFQPRSFYPQANALKPFVSSIHLPNTEHTQELSRCISNVYSLVGVVCVYVLLCTHWYAWLLRMMPSKHMSTLGCSSCIHDTAELPIRCFSSQVPATNPGTLNMLY